MSSTLPKTILGRHRTSFALIDPSTELYHRKLDHHGWLNNSTRQHVAISYVWSDWSDGPSGGLPDWDLLRKRLMCILGEHAPKPLRLETGDATCCWLDLKCIDQESASSKSYWIPRMDGVYAEARCTVLLLRDPSLAVLLPLVQNMTCSVKDKATRFDWPHICLLSQSCTTFPETSVDQEITCIRALRTLYDGTWRKRAWIFQEILLSKKFLLNFREAEYLELGDIGVMANFLFQRHLGETWLIEFSDWCRRLFYLRHFYGESDYHHLSDANVLQMAAGLQSTVPADKFYALCSVLKLKHILYNNHHTPDEAFQNVVGELVRKGRLSWLYAIPTPLNGEHFRLDAAQVTPFVLTRLNTRLVTNRNEMHINNGSFRFPAMCVGQIIRTKPLAEVLDETRIWMKNYEFKLPPELEYLFFVPKIIRRVALDVVNPLLLDPLFGQICHEVGIDTKSESRPTRAWRMIISLYTKDLAAYSPSKGSRSSQIDQPVDLLVCSAAQSLQERLRKLQHDFNVIWWRSDVSDTTPNLAIGPQSCAAGSHICSVKDDEQLQFAASFQLPNNLDAMKNLNSIDAQLQGMVYDLDSVMTIQWRVKVFVCHVTMAPLDMQGPVIGDHPFWDKFKDNRYDEYIKVHPDRPTLLSLVGKVKNQIGKPIVLNLACEC